MALDRRLATRRRRVARSDQVPLEGPDRGNLQPDHVAPRDLQALLPGPRPRGPVDGPAGQVAPPARPRYSSSSAGAGSSFASGSGSRDGSPSAGSGTACAAGSASASGAGSTSASGAGSTSASGAGSTSA